MLKTISAALIAVSVLAAPALAAGPRHSAAAPVSAKVLNANAKMGHHRHHIRHHRHLRPHVKHHAGLSAHKTFKHTAHVAKTAPKRG